MAQIPYRANLTAKVFPFITENFGNTVIIPGYDQNYSRLLTSNADNDKDIGIPQVYYAHNVWPTQSGYQSIGYRSQVAAHPGTYYFDSAKLIRDSVSFKRAYISFKAPNRCYVLREDTNTWITVVSPICTGEITVATIAGQSYIYFSQIGCYTFDFGTNLLVPVVLTALTASDILGITESFGYMIAYSSYAVYQSSTIDPTDFTPSTVTGAGGGQVQAVKGLIVAAVHHTQGFILYTTENIVSVRYSNNTSYPFIFTGIAGSGGVSSSSLITQDANTSDHIAYTSSGLQRIKQDAVNSFLIEITDFLVGQLYDVIDEITLARRVIVSPTSILKKITVVSNRYLIISYGVTTYDYAIVYDLIFMRYGKLKVTHVDCFDYFFSTTAASEQAKQSIAFLKADGSIYTIDFRLESSLSSGFILLGKYQLNRLHMVKMLSVDVQAVESTGELDFTCRLLTSLDGYNFNSTVTGYLNRNNNKIRQYLFDSTALNHTLVLKGNFNLSYIGLVLKQDARR